MSWLTRNHKRQNSASVLDERFAAISIQGGGRLIEDLADAGGSSVGSSRDRRAFCPPDRRPTRYRPDPPRTNPGQLRRSFDCITRACDDQVLKRAFRDDQFIHLVLRKRNRSAACSSDRLASKHQTVGQQLGTALILPLTVFTQQRDNDRSLSIPQIQARQAQAGLRCIRSTPFFNADDRGDSSSGCREVKTLRRGFSGGVNRHIFSMAFIAIGPVWPWRTPSLKAVQPNACMCCLAPWRYFACAVSCARFSARIFPRIDRNYPDNT